MDVSLSDEQMLSVIPKANFIPYDKLINMKDIHEVLGHNGIAIILYLTSDNYGHWVKVIRSARSTLSSFKIG